MTPRTLDQIMADIPPVAGCRVGCSDCCGPIPLGRPEVDRIKHPLRPTPSGNPRVPGEAGFYLTPPNRCGGCGYATSSGCAIYEDRPFVCRLFAAVEGEPDLVCPHGAKALNPLTAAQSTALGLEYMTAILDPSFVKARP